jgi:hypothetical protein
MEMYITLQIHCVKICYELHVLYIFPIIDISLYFYCVWYIEKHTGKIIKIVHVLIPSHTEC